MADNKVDKEEEKEAINPVFTNINTDRISLNEIDDLISIISSKTDAYVFNVAMSAKIQIPANSEEAIQPVLRIHFGSNTMENMNLYVPGKHIWIIKDVYTNNVKVDGALMLYKNGNKLLETIPLISKPTFIPILYKPLEMVSSLFIPYDTVDKNVTETLAFDVVVIDFTQSVTEVDACKIETILYNAIDEIRRKKTTNVEDYLMKMYYEINEATQRLKKLHKKKKMRRKVEEENEAKKLSSSSEGGT